MTTEGRSQKPLESQHAELSRFELGGDDHCRLFHLFHTAFSEGAAVHNGCGRRSTCFSERSRGPVCSRSLSIAPEQMFWLSWRGRVGNSWRIRLDDFGRHADRG